ncbi:hypothetical protein H5410_050461 [Solanum commersonii]|uniref:Uncharacterized protein n=1 Tax=Solanum commersonii TaxID=4109 RepID=A0A9J5WVK8_SOLCO|nr:hypothetical protein H5410_050461 [Solanum commersonii]
MRRVVEIPEILEMRMMIPCPCQFVQEKSLSKVYNERENASYALYAFPWVFLFGYIWLFLILVSMPRSPWILLCPFPVYLDCTRQRAIILLKVIHLSSKKEVQRYKFIYY